VAIVADIHLTQADADALLAMEKHRVDDTAYDYPGLGGAIRIPLQSPDKRESFILDVTRSQVNLAKGTYQNRARSVIVLARLDFGGAPHRSPDDQDIPCPHLHLYREGYGDKWAVSVPPASFSDAADRWALLVEFMRCEHHGCSGHSPRTLHVIEEVRSLLDRYAEWVRDKSVLREIGDEYVEITTPYLDRHNDYAQIYVRRDDGGFLLTDGGETIEDLRSSGCELESVKRKELLTATLNGFGVQREGDALTVRATVQNFPLRKHNLVQALLAVNDLFYLAVPIVASLFLEDVTAWLELHEIRYTPNVKFTGKSGYDHMFDFAIPASRQAPERLVRAVSRPSRDLAEALAFAWIDTKEVRPPTSRFYALLNDEERAPSPSILDALRNYDIRPVVWSERDLVREELSA